MFWPVVTHLVSEYNSMARFYHRSDRTILVRVWRLNQRLQLLSWYCDGVFRLVLGCLESLPPESTNARNRRRSDVPSAGHRLGYARPDLQATSSKSSYLHRLRRIYTPNAPIGVNLN